MNDRFVSITIGKAERLRNEGFIKQAIAVLTDALDLYPDSFDIGHALASLCIDQGNYDEARRLILSLPVIASTTHAGALYQLGNQFAGRGRFSDAAVSFERSISADGSLAGAYNNLGLCMIELGQPEPAYQNLTRAIELLPDYAETHNNLGNLCVLLFRMGEAISHFQRAIQLKPEYAAAYSNLGRAYRLCGEVDNSITLLRTSLEMEPGVRVAIDNLLFSLNYAEEDPEVVFREHERLAAIAYPAPSVFSPPSLYTHDKIRIGYVSGDFRDHPVAFFFEPMLIHSDRTQFDIFCYSQVASADDATHRLMGAGGIWRSSVGLSAEEFAELIRHDEIDILVDLAGLTENHRMDAFALKPAPVQCSWLGYPNTTGLRQMDYRITDSSADPPGMTERFHTEQLVRLPHTFLCYTPDQTAPLLPLPEGPIVFCCFNNLSKISNILLRTWSRILMAVPGSRLLLKYAFLADSASRRVMETRFAKQGIDPARVEMRGFTETKREHLELYGCCHIALDTYPYHGTTTTCEALWMGVPVITLAGKSHVSRVGVSILGALGLSEHIAATFDEYVDIAVKLAGDRKQLDSLRQTLRKSMELSALVDCSGFVAEMESAYLQMVRRLPAAVAPHVEGSKQDSTEQLRQLNEVALQLDAAGETDDAMQACEAILACDPSNSSAHLLAGTIQHRRGNLESAERHYRESLQSDPDGVTALCNLGVIEQARGETDKAISLFKQALVRDSDNAEACYNLARTYELSGDDESAEHWYRRALGSRSNYADAHFNLALLLLRNEQYAEGFSEYEWRWKAQGFPHQERHFDQPLWDGTPLGGRRILIHAEQGLGDTFQFSRYLPFVAARGGSVLVACAQSQVGLIGRIEGVALAFHPTGVLPEFDCHAPLMSLPLILGMTDGTIPHEIPYLVPETSRIIPARTLLKAHVAADSFKVGLCWRTTGPFPNKEQKICPLNSLRELFEIPGVAFCNLQPDQVPIESISGHLIDFSSHISDFDDTAALLVNMDLVISIDTALAHLAGALGCETWLLLPYQADWRWLIGRGDSPWYPGMRLFRQQSAGEWHGIVHLVAAALADRVLFKQPVTQSISKR